MEQTIETSKGPITIREGNFGDEFDALELTAAYTQATKGTPTFNPYIKQCALLSLAIVRPRMSIQEVRDLPILDGRKLMDAYDKMCKLSLGESKPSRDSALEGALPSSTNTDGSSSDRSSGTCASAPSPSTNSP